MLAKTKISGKRIGKFKKETGTVYTEYCSNVVLYIGGNQKQCLFKKIVYRVFLNPLVPDCTLKYVFSRKKVFGTFLVITPLLLI